MIYYYEVYQKQTKWGVETNKTFCVTQDLEEAQNALTLLLEKWKVYLEYCENDTTSFEFIKSNGMVSSVFDITAEIFVFVPELIKKQIKEFNETKSF